MQRSVRGVLTCLVLVTALGAPVSALAQAEVSASGTSVTPAEGRRARDASSNRGLVFPVAETTPEGDVELSSYELVLLTVAYGVTDRLQLSLTSVLPIIEGQPFFAWLTGKYAAYRDDTLVFSPLLSFNFFSAGGESLLLLTVGSLLDVILGERGQAALSFGLTGSFLLVDPSAHEADLDTFDNSGILLNVGASWEVASFVKLLFEIMVPAAIIDGEFDVAEGVLISYGVRFFSEMLAGDIGFIRPVHADIEDEFILGIPWVTFTVRI
jgi:hypothetical protein